MPKKSSKILKPLYMKVREDLGLTRDTASELIGAITADEFELKKRQLIGD